MARLEDVTDPGYLEGLEGWVLEAVRAHRDEAQEVETGLSYLRRIVQGRLDIVVAEQSRRRQGTSAVEVSELIAQLPTILGEHVHAPGLGRLTSLMGPGELDRGLEDELEGALPASALGDLPELGDAELDGAAAGLRAFEQRVSSLRRDVFAVLDLLESEIVRRYRSGEATVDRLMP